MMIRILLLASAVCYFGVAATAAFQTFPSQVTRNHHSTGTNLVLHANNNDNDDKGGGFNLFQGVSDMFAEMDNQMDDFFNKRMGNGEVFYGKRKYKPSGRENTEGEYNGMGYSDPIRIAKAQAKKESMLERRQRRLEQEQE